MTIALATRGYLGTGAGGGVVAPGPTIISIEPVVPEIMGAEPVPTVPDSICLECGCEDDD